MVVNIIHLENDPKWPHREQRERSVIKEMKEQGCEYRFWPGVKLIQKIPAISQAHKQIVRWAKENNEPFVCIAEDDLKFTALGAWQYFLQNIPSDFDIYTASYYDGRHDENFVVKGFRGMTLYVVATKFYDTFLSLTENRHIDGAISTSGGKVVVSPKFCAIQIPGYSDQRNKIVDDSHRLKGKDFFGQ